MPVGPGDQPDRAPTLNEIRQEWPPTVDVPKAALAFGLSRSHAYDLVNRREFPAKVIKVGSRYRVITESIILALSADSE
jgi:predicted DNA-binding transcriptional regulator AlpA